MTPRQLLRQADAVARDADRWLHVAYVARQLCVGRQTVRDWIHAGHIEAVRTPTGHYRIPVSELSRLETNKVRNARNARSAAF